MWGAGVVRADHAGGGTAGGHGSGAAQLPAVGRPIEDWNRILKRLRRGRGQFMWSCADAGGAIRATATIRQ